MPETPATTAILEARIRELEVSLRQHKKAIIAFQKLMRLHNIDWQIPANRK